MINEILIGITAGIISGFYTGLVMSKYAAFAQHRLAIIDIVRRIEYGKTNDILDYIKFSNTEEISHISGFLLYLGHEKAGCEGLNIFREIRDIEYKYKLNKLTFEELREKCDKWEDLSLKLKPNIFVIFSLKIQL